MTSADPIIQDPLEREYPGESHLALMARDLLAPDVVRLYATVRENSPDYKERARAILERLFLINDSRTKNPQKDQAHAWSAREIAGRMEEFYNANIRGKPPVHRLPTAERPPQERPAPVVRRFGVGDLVELIAPINISDDPDRPSQIPTGAIGIARELVEREINPGAMVEFPSIRETVMVRVDQMKHHGVA